MARKGRKKKKNQKKTRSANNYNKIEFQTVFCQTCLICPSTCDFCYTGLYKHEPKPFIHNVFNNLVDIHATYQAMGRSIKTLSTEQFQNVVCRTGICFNDDEYGSANCQNLKTCYKDFMKQMGVTNPMILHEKDASQLIAFKNKKTSAKRYISYGGKKKKKRKARYVCASYPTFFSRNNADFKAEVRRILYGDNNSEQDKDQELPGNTSGAADRHTEGGQS